MNTTQVIYLSKKGLKELKKSVSRLTHDRKQAIIDLRELDKTDGREERLELIERLAHLEAIEAELAEKQASLAMAKQFPRKRDAIKVAIGSVVELIDKSGRKFVYTIVDSMEANPSDGRISIKSPLGQSLVGKTIADTVRWGAGLKVNQVQLVGIH